VTVAVATALPKLAVTVATPLDIARTTPNSSGDAIPGCDDVQLALTLRDVPSEKFPVTIIVSDLPTTISNEDRERVKLRISGAATTGVGAVALRSRPRLFLSVPSPQPAHMDAMTTGKRK